MSPGHDKAQSGGRKVRPTLHEPLMSEMKEPEDKYRPIPVWLVLVFFGLLMWGGWYLGNYNAGWRMDIYDAAPGLGRGGSAGSVEREQPQMDPVELGKRIYVNCRACHQSNGQGVEGNYPPLDGSEWVAGPPETLVRIVLDGLQGPVEVAGQTYDSEMPGWRSSLDDRQVAAVLTYVRQAWSNDYGPVAAERVGRIREQTAGRGAFWTAAALRAAEQASPPEAEAMTTETRMNRHD